MSPAPGIGDAERPRCAFYCVSDERYFLGAVAMINSLRLHGHSEPVLLLDCGLNDAQRELLDGEVTLVEAPGDTAPYLLKTVAPLCHPAQTMVLIDADMIVTRPLGELIERAAAGAVVAFRNNRDRHVPAWSEILDLGPIRRVPYVSSGFVATGGEVGRRVIRLLDEHQRLVDFEETFYGRNDPAYPFLFPEQDVLNAILGLLEPEQLIALEHRLAPNQPFRGLQALGDPPHGAAYADGAEPYVLHHYLDKPWLEPMYHGIYSQLFVRMLLGEGVAIRIPAAQLPRRMRPGPIAWVERKAVNAADLTRWYARDVIPERLGRRPADGTRPGR